MTMTRVRATGPGGDDHGLVVCAWDECERPAWDEIKIKITDPGSHKTVHYIFCTERHRDYYRHSHVKMGMLPPGSKLSVL